MPRRALFASALLLLALPAVAPAQVRRCALADGTTVFTDQRCDVIGATERAAPPAATPQLRSYRPACPRTLRDLALEVSSAVESHDVNRLAGVYLWSGVGTREGYALMDRLQAVVDRPFVDLQPIWPGGDDATYPTTVPTRPPIGLKLEQTSSRGSTPMQAVFGLRRHLDCWWIVEGGARRAAVAPTPRDPDEPTD
jgi:hypothetical protein